MSEKKKTTLIEVLIEKAETLGWSVFVDEDEVEFRKESPLGEDFTFYVPVSNLCIEVSDYYDNFDPEEHAVDWYSLKRAQNASENMKKSIPSSIRDLLDDADAIKDSLYKLQDELWACLREYVAKLAEIYGSDLVGELATLEGDKPQQVLYVEAVLPDSDYLYKYELAEGESKDIADVCKNADRDRFAGTVLSTEPITVPTLAIGKNLFFTDKDESVVHYAMPEA